MLRFFKTTGIALTVAGLVTSASGFALLGPPDAFETTRIGYMLVPNDWNGDIGAPMNLGDEYRWNIPTITYGFDNSFKTYFGQKGMNEIRKAIAILNNIRPASRLSADLREFPTDVRRQNYRAAALGLFDLKSFALGMLVEQLGLASPERYAWTLRDRVVFPTEIDFYIIMRNFDPVTLFPSPYVNDTLYTWVKPPTYAATSAGDVDIAVTIPVDPTAPYYTSVASTMDSQFGDPLNIGDFLTGLTRDDVGGLRYLYAKRGPYANYNIETLLPIVNTNNSTGGGRAFSVGSFPAVGTALRPGVDKLQFREAKYDSNLGSFIAITNHYTDTYVTNFHRITQRLQIERLQPDIIFGAADLDAGALSRSTTSNWVNNAAINANVLNAGPGVIQPVMFLVFNKVGPLFVGADFNTGQDFLDSQTAVFNFLWASFDGTTNEPFIYPVGPNGQPAVTTQEREQQVLRNH